MRYESSYGIIPFRKSRNEWQVLLIQHQKGHWSFPKGHAEKGEDSRTAASRELKEETGLSIVGYLSEEALTEHYFFTMDGEKISKKVTYFIAKVKGRLKAQEQEIAQCQWFSIDRASEQISFPQARLVFERAKDLLLRL